MNLTGKTCGPWKVDRLGRLHGPKGYCLPAPEFTAAEWEAKSGRKLGKPARVLLGPLRRLEAHGPAPEIPTHPGWPESFDPFGLLGGFNEGRALCRSREVAERAGRQA